MAAVLALDLERNLVAPEPDRAPAFAGDAVTVDLAGNLPLALAQHVVDGRGDGGDHLGALAFRRLRVEAFREIPRR